ncbi:MAG: MFS transporter [Alicyclobacillus sp.]|nr:MFS transporter [Alicyclobacillus sp.]
MNALTQTAHKWVSGYPREAYAFVAASLMNAVGNALLWPLTTIYVHNVLHRSYGEAGFVLLFQSLAGIVGQLLGGGLYHRLGAKRLIVGSLLLTGCAQWGLIFAKAWSLYILVMAVNGLLNSITMPAVNAFIGFRWPTQRERLYNAVYVFNNIGVAVGTTLAGLLAAVSFNLTFLFDGFSTIGFGVFFWVFLRRTGHSEDGAADALPLGARPQAELPGIGWLLRDYRLYLFLAVGAVLATVSTSAWNSGVAPYLNQQGLSPATYSFLWTVNGLTILFGQPLTTFLNRRVTQSLYHRLTVSALLYAVGFGFMLALHRAYGELVVGMVICTFGEMLMNPTQPALIAQTTGKSAPFYLGLVGGCSSIGRLIGPPVFGNLFDTAGVTPILATSAAATAAAAVMFAAHYSVRKRPGAPPGRALPM